MNSQLGKDHFHKVNIDKNVKHENDKKQLGDFDENNDANSDNFKLCLDSRIPNLSYIKTIVDMVIIS